MLYRTGLCTRQALLSREFVILCKLWWLSRRSVFDICGDPILLLITSQRLLIAGIFSFMNAAADRTRAITCTSLARYTRGSWNGDPKLQAIPMFCGRPASAVHTVMGRHYKNMDTSSLPFSYLIESNDESILVPAINLRSVGTIRCTKWAGTRQKEGS